MNQKNHTNNNLLIAEYTLGLLSLEETAAAQALLGRDPQAVVDALKWEHALLELTDRLTPATLPDLLWQEISDALDLEPRSTDQIMPARALVKTTAPTPPAPTPPVPSPDQPAQTMQAKPDVVPAYQPTSQARQPAAQPLPLRPEQHSRAANTPAAKQQPRKKGWRPSLGQIAFIGIFLAGATLAIGLMPRAPALPPVTVVEMAPTQAAILQAPGQSSTPGWVVTVTPTGDVLLSPHVRTDIPADASVQLWTYSLELPTPRSLGLIDPNQPVTVPADLMGTIGEHQFFEMTQEPEGGSVSAGPSGPVLFIGRTVTFGQPMPPPPDQTVDATAQPDE